MADVKVPIKFEIYKGDELVREEVLAQDVIKVGKLASSHLRLDDETVSRMHAVIEIDGPRRHPRHRPRLDPRNDRQRRADHQGPPAVGRRDHVRRQPRGRDLPRAPSRRRPTPAPPQAARLARGRPPAQQFAPPPQQAVRAAARSAVRAAAPSTPPPAGYQDQRYQQQSYAPAASFVGRAGRRRRGRGPRRLARHGGPDASSAASSPDPPPLQPRGEVDARPGDVDAVRRHRRAGHRARRPSSPRPSTSAREKARYEAWQTAGKESKSFVWKSRSPVVGGRSCSAASSPASRCRTWASSGAARRAANFSSAPTPTSTRRSRRTSCRRSSHPLVAATGADYVVNVTPRMTRRGLRRRPELPAAAVHPAARLELLAAARAARARLDCGETTFLVTSTARAARARGAVPDLDAGTSRSTRSARRVALALFLLDDLLDPAGSEVAVARRSS